MNPTTAMNSITQRPPLEVDDETYERNRLFVWPGAEPFAQGSDRNSPRTLPYGLWTANNGEEWLFDRGYQGIIKRGGAIDLITRAQRHISSDRDINGAKEEYFYYDGCSPKVYPEVAQFLEKVYVAFLSGEDVRQFLHVD